MEELEGCILMNLEGFNTHCDWCGEYLDECQFLTDSECVKQVGA